MSDSTAGSPPAANKRPSRRRLIVAGILLVAALPAAMAVPVRSGEALVVTRLGTPTRTILEPGLAWKLPAPLERVKTVDRRLRTTPSGRHGVLTRDGLSLVAQVHAAWRVPGDGQAVLRHLRATGGNADLTATQLRTLLNSALETVVGRFALEDLVNTDAERVRLGDLEAALVRHIADTCTSTLGIELVQVGVERLLLPEATIKATVARMVEERRVVAEERQAAGRQAAARIRAEADTAARITKAEAEREAATVEAAARAEAARIYGEAHAQDPGLYAWLRSLDTLENAVGNQTRIILSTGSPPFDSLVTPPPATASDDRP